MRSLSPLVLVVLTACGVDPLVPLVEVRPDPADFAEARLGALGPELDITLENTGPAAVRIARLTIEGEAARHVIIDEGSLDRSLDPGQRTDLRLRLDDVAGLSPDSLAELLVGVSGYAGLGESALLQVPVVLNLPASCDDDGDGFLAAACGGDDCDDDSAVTRPGAAESCNEFDDDCDGLIDEIEDVAAPLAFFADADSDGYGGSETVFACFPGPGRAEFQGDCDDRDASISPVGVERCDGVDNDCDGEVDGSSAINAVSFHPDVDLDGYGDPNQEALGCTVPEGFVLNALDCDDTDPEISPATSEVCDGRDQDCDNLIDEGAIDRDFWFPDADRDGFGPIGGAERSCEVPPGAATVGGDCDDGNPDVSPVGVETCNGVDDDCDGLLDENGEGDRSTFYRDFDDDGFGDPDDEAQACGDPDGYVVNNEDCDDDNGANFPGNTEFCDGGDNDCDGAIDEDLTCQEVCGNGLDDDGNGLVDCEDSACFGDSTCIEDCGNGADDDLDGNTDCDDPECFGAPECTPSAEICTNGLDDDGDGDIDCDDGDCALGPECTGLSESDCSNDLDDDFDGDIDCEDDDCIDSDVCAGVELCTNNVDDDLDGLIDCDDDDCIDDPRCAPGFEDCGNGIDDDFDGQIDCDDDECIDDPQCAFGEELCGNGADDDGDGLVDCEDSDCFEAPGCFEQCDNGTDDDGNGLVDCDDPACIDDCDPSGEVVVQVNSGTMHIESKDNGSREVCDAIVIQVEARDSFMSRVLRAYDVQGTIVRTDEIGDELECDWSVQSASAVYDRKFSSSFLSVSDPEARLTSVRRVGFELGAGCEDLDESILPEFLFPLPDEALIAEAPVAGVFFPEDQLTIGQEWYTGQGTQTNQSANIQSSTVTRSFQGFDLTCDMTTREIVETWDVVLGDGAPFPP